MKAIVARQFGGPEVLELEQVPEPTPGEGEVVIEVHAVSVNRTFDLNMREEGWKRGAELPLVFGADPSGIVHSVGPGVAGYRPGDRVVATSIIRCATCEFCLRGDEMNCANNRYLGVHRWGGYAEYVSVPTTNVHHVPAGLDFPQATVIARHAPAALYMLKRRAELRPDRWLLVMGAGGSLGSFGVQVGKHLGARVIAAAGSDDRTALGAKLGADATVNYRREDLAERVLEITDGAGVDVVFENVGDPTTWPAAFASLAHSGRLVTAGAHGGGLVELDLKRLYLKRLQVIGSGTGSREEVEEVLEMGERGELEPVIDRVMPLEDAQEAHRLMEAGHTHGKLILTPRDRT